MVRRASVYSLLVLILAIPARTFAQSQVGYAPATSPYRDLDPTQEVNILFGRQRNQRDALGAAPLSGNLLGVSYEWRAANAFNLGGDVITIDSHRRVFNPSTTDTTQRIESIVHRPLVGLEANMAVALPGERTWHSLVPMATVGIGVISDLHAPDSSGFKFGTRLALTAGVGVRWIPGNRFQLRLDYTDRIYSLAYPESFYLAPSATTPALISPLVSKTRYFNNTALTFGLGFLF